MNDGMQTWPGPRRIVVRAPEDPVEAVTEADACDSPSTSTRH